MLSGETAIGQYPVETVRMMRRIADQAERALPNHPPRTPSGRQAVQQALAEAAVQLAGGDESEGTRRLHALRLHRASHVLAARPLLPLIGLTEDDRGVSPHGALWGLRPVRTEFARTMDATIDTFQEVLMAEGLVDEGDLIVIVGSSIRMTDTRSNVIKLHVVGRD